MTYFNNNNVGGVSLKNIGWIKCINNEEEN